MTTLIDGPAAGAYMVRRAPGFLRGVVNRQGETDVLDLLEDVPADNETVSVYRLASEPITVHFNFGGGKGGWYQSGEYRHLPEVDGETVRDNDAWRRWVAGQVDGQVDMGTGEVTT